MWRCLLSCTRLCYIIVVYMIPYVSDFWIVGDSPHLNASFTFWHLFVFSILVWMLKLLQASTQRPAYGVLYHSPVHIKRPSYRLTQSYRLRKQQSEAVDWHVNVMGACHMMAMWLVNSKSCFRDIFLPSYKLWYSYLKLRRRKVKGRYITDPSYEDVNNAFERSLVFMHKVSFIYCCDN